MKRLVSFWTTTLALLLFLCAGANAQVSVTGNLLTLGLANVSSLNTYVQFQLSNYGSNLPMVAGTGVFVSPTLQFYPNGSGAITGQIEQNNAITPANTYYRVCIFNQGAEFRCNNYLINGNFNLNTATPINATAQPNPIGTLTGTYFGVLCQSSTPPAPSTGFGIYYQDCTSLNPYFEDANGRFFALGGTTSGLGNNNIWTGTNQFNLGITGTGTTGTLGAGSGILGGGNAWTGPESHAGAESFTQLNGSQIASTTGQTIAAAITAAGTNNVVRISAGTYTLAAQLAPLAGQRLLCDDGAIITQGNGANLVSLVNFATNQANGASLQNCTLDGDWGASFTSNTMTSELVNIGSANDVTIRDCILQNSDNVGIQVTSGLRPSIIHNRFLNMYNEGVSIFTGTGGTQTRGTIDENTFINTVLGTQFSDFNSVTNNHLFENAFAQNVTTTGTSVAFVSGTDCTACTPGFFMRIGGVEYTITAKASNTSWTITPSAGNQTNVLSYTGIGDALNFDSSSFNTISSNTVNGGMGFGIVVHQFADGAENSDSNTITGNTVNFTGGACLSVQSNASTPIVSHTIFSGNTTRNCGQGKAGNTNDNKNNLSVVGAGSHNTLIDGNIMTDDQGGGATDNYGIWINSGVPADQTLGINRVVGQPSGVVNGVNLAPTPIGRLIAANGTAQQAANIVPGAGWGSTASISAVSGQDTAFIFTVTSSGSGQAGGPGFVITFADGAWVNAPLYQCKEVNASNSADLTGIVYDENSANATTMTVIWTGTPTAGRTYTFGCQAFGK